MKNSGIDLSSYSIGHVIAYLGIIAGTAILWGLARYLRGRPWYYFPAALAGVGVVIAIVLFVALPDVYNILIGSFGAFFGQYDVTNTVQEARGWSMAAAWSTFQLGLVLMFAGFGVLAYQVLARAPGRPPLRLRLVRDHPPLDGPARPVPGPISPSTSPCSPGSSSPSPSSSAARPRRACSGAERTRRNPRPRPRPNRSRSERPARRAEEGGPAKPPTGKQRAHGSPTPPTVVAGAAAGHRPAADHAPLRLPLDLPGRPRRRRPGGLHDLVRDREPAGQPDEPGLEGVARVDAERHARDRDGHGEDLCQAGLHLSARGLRRDVLVGLRPHDHLHRRADSEREPVPAGRRRVRMARPRTSSRRTRPSRTGSWT